MIDKLLKQGASNGLDRREFLTGTALMGAMAATGGSLLSPRGAMAQSSEPQYGGHLKLGLSGGSTSDSMDPRTFIDWVAINIGYQIYNGLVEIDENNIAQPELFESWEAQPGATEWVFNVRQGVTFHNGKTLDADDVIYSINLHRGPDSTSGAKAILENIQEVTKLNDHQVQITLGGGDADLPLTLTDYHLVVVPNGFTDWENPIGTGGYRMESFEPGVRAVTVKTGDYWKPNAAYVDSIETLAISDVTSRTNALLSGQVDIINRPDGRTIELLSRNDQFQTIRSSAGQYSLFIMDVRADAFADQDVRLAMKYAIDRQRLIDTVLFGYGQLGNDHPIPSTSPYFNTELEQHSYDPDRAKFHLNKAGVSELKLELNVSEEAMPSGAIDSAVMYQNAAEAAGISIDIRRQPSDGYWDNVWMQTPFCTAWSGGRPTVDAAFSKAYKSTSAWNETFWHREEFDRIANEARSELDQAKRTEMYWECQRMISEDGGAVIPMFMDFLEAGSARVQGWKPHPVFDLMGQRIGEKVWLQA